MTQWFGKRRIKESTIIIRILRKGSMFILYVSLQTWDTSRKLDSLIKQKLFIHTVSLPDRLRRVRLHSKDCLRREIAILCVPSGALREELKRRTESARFKREEKKRKNLRFVGVHWLGVPKREAKDYVTKQNIIMFQNKLRIAH